MTDEFQVPGYDIKERIGRGGMASVYRARQHTFDRDVALKVLKPDLSEDESFCQRFVQESLIVAKLHHSHIVQVYDVGEFQNKFFIAMEYLHGGDLNTRLNKGISVNETIEIIRQAASALDFAHQKGIIHRDIKPDNIMFREDGAAVLTDFGIAKELDSDINLTQTGLIVGTPKYMAPEQIRGDKADAKADIYSLGILLFQCLTNHVPFDGKDMIATAYKHFNEPVPELPALVAAFQPIVNRMLAKHPDERYARGKDIVAALDELGQKTRTSATNLELTKAFVPPPSNLDPTLVHGQTESHLDETEMTHATQPPPKNTAKKPAKVPVIAIGGGAAGLAAIALVAIFAMQGKPTQESPAPAVEPLASEVSVDTGSTELSANDKITIDRLLAEAQIDIQAKRLTKPDSNNALNKLQRVLAINPSQAEALAAMEQIAEEYVKLAEQAIATRDFDLAEAQLASATRAAPTLGLIAVMRDKLASATEAKAAKQASISLMEQSLVIQGLLESAAIDVEEGRTHRPDGDNAAEKYRRVLSLDPDNVEAHEKLAALGEPN